MPVKTRKPAASKSPAKRRPAPTKAAAASPRSARKPAAAAAEVVTLDRRRGARRAVAAPVVAEAAPAPKLERRAKTQRRRQIDPTTCERDYSIEEVEFMNAMDDYKRTSGRMFPTCSEVLEVIRNLGYVKVSPAGRAMLNGDAEQDPMVDADLISSRS